MRGMRIHPMAGQIKELPPIRVCKGGDSYRMTTSIIVSNKAKNILRFGSARILMFHSAVLKDHLC